MAYLKIEKWGERYRLVKLDGLPKAKKNSEYVIFSPKKEGDSTATERFENNLSRAKSRVLECGYCNDWEYFVTLTLDGQLRDRFDLPAFIKALGYWIGSYNRKYHTKLKYVLIPEQHKNGAYHMHGLLNGVSPLSLITNKNGYLDMPFYRERFGFISLSRLTHKDKAVSYITKYISKGFSQTEIDSGKHLYYCSQGLNKREYIQHFHVPSYFPMDFENSYCGITWIDSAEQLEDVVFDILTHYEN